ncbi:RidA family protein [Martelella soudanensis]|uniref:RidA family protein n=1 Tax=unclassified Martelella TaxID=2629616 RepID=UPI0015DE964B|nr:MULTISPECIES: RidA family protein [unclassified Martelella]
MTGTASTRLSTLGLTLPKLRAPVGNFVMAKRHRDLLYLSGQGPNTEGAARISGKVGDTVSVEEAYQHARLVTLNLLSVADNHLGSLDRIDAIIKVLGFVNAAPDFTAHPSVINGCSDLLVELFGPDHGSHARSAIGAGSLPAQITVEIEMIVSCR